MTELLSGTLLGGRYRVGALLGQGGMGAVYEGRQEGLDRRVALKVLHAHLATEQDLISRFKREAHAVATLGHPNVVQISDFQANAGEPPFLVMELLHGESLRDLLKRHGTLPPERVAYIFQQVLAALEAAHAKDIVHRDIKPDNVFLCATSVQADLVKILDFGVAKILRQEDPNIGKLTKNGFVVGTLSYMAPEQATGDSIDGRADLYSVGACMYLALTGRKPFDAPTTPAILRAILTERHVPVAAVRQDIDLALAALVDRALAKRPSDRFANAREMATALAVFAKPTPLEPSASEAPTLPRDDAPATVGPKHRAISASVPTVDAKALAMPVPTAPAPNAGKKTLISAGNSAKPAEPPVTTPMSATPPPDSMGPDALATMRLGTVQHEDDHPPDTEPPQAIGEGARAPLPTAPVVVTARSATDARPPMRAISTTLKMPSATPAPAAAPASADPLSSDAHGAGAQVNPRPAPARVQIPIAPPPANRAPMPARAAATRTPSPLVTTPPRRAKTSMGGILVITFLVLFVLGVLALGVGLFALRWFTDAAEPAPVPSETQAPPPSAVMNVPSATATDTTDTTDTTAKDALTTEPASHGKSASAMGTMATPLTTTAPLTTAGTAVNPTPALTMSPALASAASAAAAMASTAPRLFGSGVPPIKPIPSSSGTIANPFKVTPTGAPPF